MSFQRELKEEVIPNIPAPQSDDFDDIDLQFSIPLSLQAHHIAMISSQLKDPTTQHDPEPDNDDLTIFQRVRIIDKLFPPLYPFQADSWGKYMKLRPLIYRQELLQSAESDGRDELEVSEESEQELLQSVETDGREELETSVSGEPEHIRVNEWLLHNLRSSSLAVDLLTRVAKQQLSTTLPNIWEEAVLSMWYRDGTTQLAWHSKEDATSV